MAGKVKTFHYIRDRKLTEEIKLIDQIFTFSSETVSMDVKMFIRIIEVDNIISKRDLPCRHISCTFVSLQIPVPDGRLLCLHRPFCQIHNLGKKMNLISCD